MADRRKGARTPLKAKVIISVPGVKRIIEENAYLRNIGKNGFAFATKEALIRGGTYHFDVATGDRHLDMVGRIVHLRPEATYYICGIRFEQLSFPQRSRLNRLLTVHLAELQKKFLIYSLLAALGVAFIVNFFLGAGMGITSVAFLVAAIGFYILLPF